MTVWKHTNYSRWTLYIFIVEICTIFRPFPFLSYISYIAFLSIIYQIYVWNPQYRLVVNSLFEVALVFIFSIKAASLELMRCCCKTLTAQSVLCECLAWQNWLQLQICKNVNG